MWDCEILSSFPWIRKLIGCASPEMLENTVFLVAYSFKLLSLLVKEILKSAIFYSLIFTRFLTHIHSMGSRIQSFFIQKVYKHTWQYFSELTGGRGTIFATGTPISNSMVELYTIQRYLQYNTLVKNNLQHFDSWASTFGETVTAVELTPEGYTLIGR